MIALMPNALGIHPSSSKRPIQRQSPCTASPDRDLWRGRSLCSTTCRDLTKRHESEKI